VSFLERLDLRTQPKKGASEYPVKPIQVIAPDAVNGETENIGITMYGNSVY